LHEIVTNEIQRKSIENIGKYLTENGTKSQTPEIGPRRTRITTLTQARNSNYLKKMFGETKGVELHNKFAQLGDNQVEVILKSLKKNKNNTPVNNLYARVVPRSLRQPSPTPPELLPRR
jgi:hypothetical protein